MIQETIFGVIPSKSNSYRFANGRVYKTKEMQTYENNFIIQCRNRNARISGKFNLNLRVYYPSMRSDLDGALKATLDLLQKCAVIKNDNKCMLICAQKFVDKKNPRVEISIEEVGI